MSKLVRKLAAAWSEIPASVKSQSAHVALTFAVAFVAVAAPAAPAIWGDLQLGHLPRLTVLHAVLAAGVAAGIKAAIPVGRAAVVSLISNGWRWVQSRKSRKLQAAVEAYLAVKAAAEAAQAAQARVDPVSVPDAQQA